MSYLLYPKFMLLLAIPAYSLKQVGTVMTEPKNAVVYKQPCVLIDST